jgi:hypothetical protein
LSRYVLLADKTPECDTDGRKADNISAASSVSNYFSIFFIQQNHGFMNPNWCRQQLIINRLHRMNMNERNPDYLQDAAICCVKTAQFTHSFASIPISNKVIESQGVSSRFHT